MKCLTQLLLVLSSLLGSTIQSVYAESTLFYSSRVDSNANSIYTMSPSDFEPKLFMRYTVSNRGEEAVDFSPRSNKLVFGTYRYGGWKLAVADYQGGKPAAVSNIKKLTQSDTYKYQPKLSPDGKLVVYRNYYTKSAPRFSGGDYEIYLYDLERKTDINLTKSVGPDVTPVWSPDQKQILFSSDRKINGIENYDLYTIDMDTLQQRPLVMNEKASDVGASYSNDGGSIAFLRLEHAKLALYIANADGSEVKNLTDGLVENAKFRGHEDLIHYGYNTVWSPDNNKIAFIGHWEKDREVYLYDLTEGTLTNLTNNRFDEYYVNWEKF